MADNYQKLNDITGLPDLLFGSSPAETQYAAGIASQESAPILALRKRGEMLDRQALLERAFGQLNATNADRMKLNQQIHGLNLREQDVDLLKKHPELGNVLFGRIVPDDPMSRPTGSMLSALSMDKTRSETGKNVADSMKSLVEAGKPSTATSLDEFLSGAPMQDGVPLSLQIARLDAAAKISAAEISATGSKSPKLRLQVGDGATYDIILTPEQLRRYNEIRQQLSTASGKDEIGQKIEAIIQTLIEVEGKGNAPKAEPVTPPTAAAKPGAAPTTSNSHATMAANLSDAARAQLQSTMERIRKPEQQPRGKPVFDQTAAVPLDVQKALGVSTADAPYRIVKYKTDSGKVIAFAYMGDKWLQWLE